MSQTTRTFETVHAPSTDLSETERHRLLESARRRYVLDAFADHEGPMALTDVATAVIERDGDLDASDADDVATELHHSHLPKLAAAGVLEYDAAANRVTE